MAVTGDRQWLEAVAEKWFGPYRLHRTRRTEHEQTGQYSAQQGPGPAVPRNPVGMGNGQTLESTKT